MPHHSPSYLFFFDHAGFSYDPLTETAEQGQARCAEQLADAEEQARDAGCSFEWSIDPGTTSADWIDDRKNGGKRRNPWATWQCLMRDADGAVVQALGGIDFGRDGSPWGDPYRRVIEAELALEWMAEQENRT